MIIHNRYLLLVLLSAMFTSGFIGCDLSDEKEAIKQTVPVDRAPVINPDFTQTVIPPNIAPLNFIVREAGSKYYVKIYSKQADPIEVFSKKPAIIIPEKPWKKLLNSSKGNDLYFDVYVKDQNDHWKKFLPITNKIANEKIDDYLVYRIMDPIRTRLSGFMGIYQRNLANFDETVILDSRFDQNHCHNCHKFCKNDPDKMLLGARKHGEDVTPATLMIDDGKVYKIDSMFGYSSWHPSCRLVAYSINEIPMFFHLRSTRNEIRDTIETNSALAYYLIDDKEIKTTPQFSKKERLENWPAWSADGKYLYFCSAPVWKAQQNQWPPKWYDKIKYDLVRISYDLEKDTWGKVETVLHSKDTGLSIAMPHISPDGRWLLFCMCDYSFFPTWQESSDLYITDLKVAEETGQYHYRRLEINSNQSESWQSFSSNSRWIAFSSKRGYGRFTKLYFSYIDKSGRVFKPLLLPQKDPEFYNRRLSTYSIPEFITGPVKHVKGELARIYRSSDKINVTMPITMASPAKDLNIYRQEQMYGEQR